MIVSSSPAGALRLLPRWPPALPALGPRHSVGAARPILVLVPEPIGTAIRAPELVPACVGVRVSFGVRISIGVPVGEQVSVPIAIPVAEQVGVPVAVVFVLVCFVLTVVSFLVSAPNHVGYLLAVREL